jgi:hypothetical protein
MMCLFEDSLYFSKNKTCPKLRKTMFIQFDTHNKTLKKFTDTACSCSKCRKRTIEFTISRKFFQLYWIPFIPLGKIEIDAYCNYCNQRFPENIRFKYHLSTVKTPLYLYSGLIIVALFFISVAFQAMNKENRTETYLNNPEIGDVYLIRNSYEQDTSYSFLRLVNINSTKDSLSFYGNEKLYLQRPSKLSDEDYFIPQKHLITSKHLNALFKENKIISIERSDGLPQSYKEIRPKEKVDSNYIYVRPDSSISIWGTLLSLKFDISFDEKSNDIVFKPKFNESIRKLNGLTVTIKAFMYTEDVSNGSILLSAYCENPRNSCTPPTVESLIEMPKTPGLMFKSCKSCIVRGELNINTDDLLKIPYSLKNIDFLYCEDFKKNK